VSSVAFSDGQTIAFESTDVVLIVGPNNSGKSAALRGIRDRLHNPATQNPVVKAAQAKKTGTTEQLLDWLASWVMKREDGNPGNPVYHAFGHGLHLSQVQADWGRGDGALAGLLRWMCVLLNADERLQMSRPASSISLVRDPPSHPNHYLQRDDALELRLSNRFRQAFGVDLIVHRNAGNQVPLHVGERPIPGSGEDRVSVGFISRLEQLPTLEDQGDGMRSFAGVLLATSVGRESILLVDEPEAFLHPPQSRLLGRMLVTDRRSERQLFIATHSSDIIRGVLDVESSDIRVLRLRRENATNVIRELKNSRIKELWADPLLRYSNILDGLVHEHVVVCEGDADCRFYGAVLDVLVSQGGDQIRRPDVMFTHAGGNARLATIVRALHEVEVPVTAVADFDILSEKGILQNLVEALGGSWIVMESSWTTVKAAVDGGHRRRL
jgi:predicted ATPase